MSLIRLGTRGSQLALAQAQWVAAEIHRMNPLHEVELVVIKTTGDIQATQAFRQVGTKGMFVKELEDALLHETIDIAVHSMKDLPGECADGLLIAATPRRADPRDALVGASRLDGLPPGSHVGTSSIRRQALLRHYYPQLNPIEFRGNVDTRLAKLKQGQAAALLMASAGLDRMGLSERIGQRLDANEFTPPPGQGALAIQTRLEDPFAHEITRCLQDAETWTCTLAERSLQRAMTAGCSVPLGAIAILEKSKITLEAMVAAPDGSRIVRERASGSADEAESIGKAVADRLKAQREVLSWLELVQSK